jgi:hypothetical protein
MTFVAEKGYTAEDLRTLPDRKKYELVDGRLVERRVSALSSWVSGRLFRFIYRRDGSTNWLREDGELSGEDVLAGFRVPVTKIFPGKTAGKPEAGS